MEHYIRMRSVSLDDSVDLDEPHKKPTQKKQPFKKIKHEVQMSIIPEKKEEFDVSPSVVELEQQRRKERNVDGFRLGPKGGLQQQNMTRTERIKQQQMELMLNL